jgi:hypothetical protein
VTHAAVRPGPERLEERVLVGFERFLRIENAEPSQELIDGHRLRQDLLRTGAK